MNVFDRINEWLDRTEVSWVNLLTKALPILVPIIPAMQTKRHVVEVLGYSQEASWIAAIIVEFFGYAAMYKMIQFAEHNRRYAEKNRAPFGVAVMIYLAYLAIIIVFNVIPEVVTKQPVHVIWMNALFAVLSVPAGALTAVSALHTERKEAMKRRGSGTSSETTSETPLPKRVPKPLPEVNTSRSVPQPIGFDTSGSSRTGRTPVHQERVFEYMDRVLSEQGRVASFSEVEQALNLPQSTASRLRNDWREKNGYA